MREPFFTIITLLWVLLVPTALAAQITCEGPYKNGTRPTQEELEKIVRDHLAWVKSGKPPSDAQRANLCGADLRGVDLEKLDPESLVWSQSAGQLLHPEKHYSLDLRGANLMSAKLRGANLRGVNLQEADLRGADLVDAILIQALLTKADLRDADLSNARLQRGEKIHIFLAYSDTTLKNADLRGAVLSGADLSGANLESANLGGSILIGTKFAGASLRKANLQNAELRQTDFSSAKLTDADLSVTQLNKANLAGTELVGAILHGVNLSNADLQNFDMRGVNLSYARLIDANLAGTKLKQANLEHAKLIGTDLAGADLAGANLSEASFEPSNVDRLFVFGARGLSTIQFERSDAAVDLRVLTQKLALRNETKALTSALTKYRLQGDSGWTWFVEAVVKGGFVSDYGANPIRLVWALFVSMVVFAAVYWVVLSRRESQFGIIWKEWSLNRPPRKRSKPHFERLQADRWWERVRWALQFSLLSGFRFGWRELNFGNWIARLQRDEYLLRGTGWIRTISGLQSIVAFYLLALWALTYFTPWFE